MPFVYVTINTRSLRVCRPVVLNRFRAGFIPQRYTIFVRGRGGRVDGVRAVYPVVTQNRNFDGYRPRPRATEPPRRVVLVRMQASTRIHGS